MPLATYPAPWGPPSLRESARRTVSQLMNRRRRYRKVMGNTKRLKSWRDWLFQLSLATRALPKPHLPRQLRARDRIIGGDYRIVGREAPFLAIAFRRQVIMGAQMTLRRTDVFFR